MPFLVAAVVLVGIIGLTNLVFTFGVIRRLREHTEVLDRLGGGMGPVMLQPGESVADFDAVTVDGDVVTTDWPPDRPTLIGFFSPTCEPCRAKLPVFVDYASRLTGGRDRVLAVVVGESDESAAPLVADLRGVARVVREAEGGQVQKAFGVQGFPAFGLIGPKGEVRASGSDVSAVSVSSSGV